MSEFETEHNPDSYMADLRHTLSQGRKRIGLLIGAGAPMAILVNKENRIVTDGASLIPNVEELTRLVVQNLSAKDGAVIASLNKELEQDGADINVETILTQVRRLAEAIGDAEVHKYDSNAYSLLASEICQQIGTLVSVDLPGAPNPYTQIASWIGGTRRSHAVEIFTPNYDLLFEQAFERQRLPYFDGFVGAYRPFFDPASVSSNHLPARWSRLWKLHGSLGWERSENGLVRTGSTTATQLIYPEHLKYDQVTRMPYSALFDRLHSFLMTPDTLLLCAGFSFRDAHICAVLEEALAANAHVAVLAMQYKSIAEEEPAVQIAQSRPNLSVYACDGAVISGVCGAWVPSGEPSDERKNIRRTFWQDATNSDSSRFLLGDFVFLSRFLAMTQASRMAQLPSSEPAALSTLDDDTSSAEIDHA